MEIVRKQAGSVLELTINGRLDAYWADHLGAALDEALREGADDIRVDMAEVAYMSSVGIRVLLRYFKEARRLQGSFAVCNPSAAVRSVLELAGLEALLLSAAAAPATVAAPVALSQHVERDGARFEVFELDTSASFAATCLGEPALREAYAAAHCRTLRVTASVVAVGLGSFGRDFDDCRSRFGEFLAAGGASAFLPTDGTNVPDSLVATGAFEPELQVLNGVACDGAFSHLARFETAAGTGPISLQALVGACLSIAGADAAAITIVAESAGLMGAALRRSPAGGTEGTHRTDAATRNALPRPPGEGQGGGAHSRTPASSAFSFSLPEIRDWLSFTPERAHARGLALITGIAARQNALPRLPGEGQGGGATSADLAAFLRPLGASGPTGHFHAAAFSYQPLRKGRLELPATLSTLFETAALEGVLHLLNDDRPIIGSGQSELVRGACWIGPITSVGSRA